MSSQKPKSKYASKVSSGKQMYGPGCCAHTVTSSRIEAAKEAARDAPRPRPKFYTKPNQREME